MANNNKFFDNLVSKTKIYLIIIAILFLILGIIGEYLAIMFSEIKDRPSYIIENME